MHRDVSKVLWSAGTLRFLRTVAPDAMVQSGDYIHVSEPHDYENCPFKKAHEIPWFEAAGELESDGSERGS